MAEPEIEQLRGNFCLAASRNEVDGMQPYLKMAANDPCRDGILTMAFSVALQNQHENSVRCLVPVLATAGITGDCQTALARAQGADRFFSSVVKKLKAEAA
jgi:hypothetical protein